ncbi:MAG: alcohol dehydrogenase [Pedosphaera sp.]|nr:alcohol dehydrogenase [Pedosphaera sp.]
MKEPHAFWMGSIAFAATTSFLFAADWPQYRGSHHDGSTTEKIAAKWPEKGLRQVWKIPAPGGFSSFAVSGGRAVTQVVRNSNECVLALDALTGKEQWAVELAPSNYGHDGGNAGANGNNGGDGPRSTPSLDGAHVYVLAADLRLLCLEAATGKKVWAADLLGEHGGQLIKWKNAASPLIDGELVFAAGGGAGATFLAFNKTTGQVVWKSGAEIITHATPVRATIHGVPQVIFFAQSGLIALERNTGKELWRQAYRFSVSTAMAPVVAGDTVYCSAGYGVGGGAYKISKQGEKWAAEELWRAHGNGQAANHWSTPVHKDGHLYGMFSFKEYGTGPFKCVEVATGKVKWQQANFGAGNVILADGQLLALTDFGDLVLVAAEPGACRELARTKVLTGKCWSTPVLSNGRVYVRSTKEAACLELPRAVPVR